MAFDTSGIRLKPCVDLFSTEASRQDASLEKIREIPLDQLVPFKDHPFKVIDDESMMDTVQSIREHGILLPLIARPIPDGKYEIVSGHRRSHAGKLAGLETVPVIVRELDDDAAVILMVDSNLQRENILPSERAFAFKMKLEAMKHQGQRNDLSLCQVGTRSRADEKLAQSVNESARTIQRYIRLTELLPELLDLVDERKLAFNSAVEVSYDMRKPHRKQLLAWLLTAALLLTHLPVSVLSEEIIETPIQAETSEQDEPKIAEEPNLSDFPTEETGEPIEPPVSEEPNETPESGELSETVEIPADENTPDIPDQDESETPEPSDSDIEETPSPEVPEEMPDTGSTDEPPAEEVPAEETPIPEESPLPDNEEAFSVSEAILEYGYAYAAANAESVIYKDAELTTPLFTLKEDGGVLLIASQKYKPLNITPTSCSLLSLTVRKTAKLMKSPRRMKPIPATSASAKPQSEAAFRLQGFSLTSTTTTNTAPVWQGR